MGVKLDGDHLKQSLIDAGFEKIKIIRKDIDIGVWREGNLNSITTTKFRNIRRGWKRREGRLEGSN